MAMSRDERISEINKFFEKKLSYFGEGGFGLIFLAEYNNKKSVVKVFNLDVDSIDSLPFKREKIDIKKIKHPNMMEVYEISNKFGFIISEYCGNINLEKRVLDKNNSFIKKNILAFWDILKGVKYLVENNLSHSDIKSDNIVFNSEGNPKIIDYDTLKRTDNITKYSLDSIFACSYFPVPEILNGEVSEKTDVFSLGGILYYILQKKYIFEDDVEIIVGENLFPINRYFNILKSDFEYKMVYQVRNKLMKKLIRKMIEIDFDKRIYIYEVMNMFESALPLKTRKMLKK
jgi:serine/threonine protein kinase